MLATRVDRTSVAVAATRTGTCRLPVPPSVTVRVQAPTAMAVTVNLAWFCGPFLRLTETHAGLDTATAIGPLVELALSVVLTPVPERLTCGGVTLRVDVGFAVWTAALGPVGGSSPEHPAASSAAPTPPVTRMLRKRRIGYLRLWEK